MTLRSKEGVRASARSVNPTPQYVKYGALRRVANERSAPQLRQFRVEIRERASPSSLTRRTDR